MILESIVTTLSESGQVNIAPMGPVVARPDAMRSSEPQDPGFLLRPFEGSRTFDNLIATGRATIHVSDDAALFAAAATGSLREPEALVQRSPCGRFAPLCHCHRWFAVDVESITATPPRYEMQCRVVDSAIDAPVFGFNRAKHAVIEAAILATRTHLLSATDILSQLDALRPLVDKTAGAAEHEAFDQLVAEIHRRIDRDASDQQNRFEGKRSKGT